MDYLNSEEIEQILAQAEEIEADEAVAEQLTEAKINIHDITFADMKNGEDIGVVLWVAGCSHHCKNCQNPQTWDPKSGIPFTSWEEAEFYGYIKEDYIKRVTFTGGDPLFCSNRDVIGKIAKNIKEKYPDKKIWLYTGYSLIKQTEGFKFEDLSGNGFSYPYLKYIDVLVDGPFMTEIRDSDIKTGKKVPWRGSSNQRVVDVQASLNKDNVVCRYYDNLGNYQLID